MKHHRAAIRDQLTLAGAAPASPSHGTGGWIAEVTIAGSHLVGHGPSKRAARRDLKRLVTQRFTAATPGA